MSQTTFIVCSWLLISCLGTGLVVAGESCTLDDETAYVRRVEAVKAQILSKLGLTEAPKVNFSDEHPALNSEVMRTYRAAMMRRKRRSALDYGADSLDEGNDHYFSHTNNLLDIRGEVVRAHHDHIALLVSHQEMKRKLPGNLSDVHRAELNFAYSPGTHEDKDGPRGSHVVRIELLAKIPHPLLSERYDFVDGVNIDLARKDHIVFDISLVLQRWLSQSESCPNGTCRLELHVHAMHREEDAAVTRFINGIMPLQVGDGDGEDPNSLVERRLRDAHILVMSHSAAPNARRLRRRTKRQTLDGDYCRTVRGRNPNNCCVKDLELNFRRDLGWDWVREPQKFKPNHCSGACPYRWSSGSAYSSVISMYNNLNPQASAKPCCVADQLGSVVLLFTTGSHSKDARVETLNMMTVLTCKCK